MNIVTYDPNDELLMLKHCFITICCLLLLGVHLFLFTPSSEFLIGDWLGWAVGLCISIIGSVITVYEFMIKRLLVLRNRATVSTN